MVRRVLRHTFSLLNVDYVQLGKKWNYSGVMSPYYRLYYIDAGFGEIVSAGIVHQLEAGYLYLIPSFTPCDLRCSSFLSQYFIQFFEESTDGVSLFADNRSIYKVPVTELDIMNFNRLLQINPGRGINRSDNPRIYEKKIYYEEYQELNNRQGLADYFETHAIILQLVSRFLTADIFKPKKFRNMPCKIHHALSYILMNLDRKITVTMLAEQANQNIDHFSRLFQLHLGARPLDYIITKKVERAQYLIVTTQMTFTEIAAATGFESVSYFSRIFKKITGTSPSVYRAKIEEVN